MGLNKPSSNGTLSFMILSRPLDFKKTNLMNIYMLCAALFPITFYKGVFFLSYKQSGPVLGLSAPNQESFSELFERLRH